MSKLAPLLALPLVLAGCADPPACVSGPVADLPVTWQRGFAIIQASLDGQPGRFMLDTGSGISLLRRSAMERMGLRPDLGKLYAISGEGGVSTGHAVQVQKIQLGDAAIEDKPVVISPFPLRIFADHAPDGMLGSDVLADFDVDLDLPHSRITLYQGGACSLGRPPWPGGAVALETPEPTSLDIRPNVPVTLESLTLTALLDTGADVTAVSQRAALAAGADGAALSASKAVRFFGASPFETTMRHFTFNALTIGNERIVRPTLAVGIGGAGKDMFLGLDFLRHHRVWIAFHARRVFLSSAGKPSG